MTKIGTHGWVRELRSRTELLGSEFWSGFTSATESDLRQIETHIQRNLDPEFREFYRKIGYGSFCNRPGYGDIYSPEEIIQAIANPIFFVTGSMTPGAEWAPLDRQVELWLSRGRSNPNRTRFTAKALTLDGVRLYNLLQIGSDGGCRYHHLYVGPEPAPLRYCLLTDSQELTDRAMTFSEGLEMIIQHYLDSRQMDV